MQFFPHIERLNFPPSSAAGASFADRQPDEGFATLLSSQMDRHDVDGEATCKSEAHSESETFSSGAEAEAARDFGAKAVSRHETPHEEAAVPERLAGEHKEIPVKSATREESEPTGKKKGVKGKSVDKVGPPATEILARELADAIHTLEALLEPVRSEDPERRAEVRKDNAQSALLALRGLLESFRAEAPASPNDARTPVRPDSAQAAEKTSAPHATRSKSGAAMPRGVEKGDAEGAVGKGIREVFFRDDAVADALKTLEAGRETLSAQDRELLREALSRLRDAQERLAGTDGTREPVPVGRHKVTAGLTPRDKAEQVVSLTVSKDKDAGAEQVPEMETPVRTIAAVSPAAVRVVQDRTQGEPAGNRDASLQKQVEPDVRASGKAVLPELSSGSGQDRMDGNFFRERGAERNGTPEKEISGPPEGIGTSAPRKTVDAGSHRTLKIPEPEGGVAPQEAPSARPATVAPGIRARSAEVFRQVETGAFRELGQGSKELVIRLDPPDLGQVSVILQVRGKDVQAVLRTSNQETSQILNDQLGQLRTQLESQGLKVARLEVQTQLADSQTDSQWQGAEQHNRYQENRELAMTARRMRSLGRVDGALAREVQYSPHKENISLTGVDVFA